MYPSRHTACLIITILSFIQGVSYAQDPVELGAPVDKNSQYSPSPKALDNTRYGILPVDLNSGTMSMEIPVGAYQDQDFYIPISLRYSYSGFRPASPSGEAGAISLESISVPGGMILVSGNTWNIYARVTDRLGNTPGINPYAYCAGNPVKFVDPNGLSTWVYKNENGTYTVFGESLEDDDLNVYVYTMDENGHYTIRGRSIGKTLLLTSFYDCDFNNGEGGWALTSIIDLNDKSAMLFIEEFLAHPPHLVEYIPNATNNQLYDFKESNGKTPGVFSGLNHYRGMSLGEGVITSARDVGNFAAGYIAGYNGIPYTISRLAYDSYQTYTDNKTSIDNGGGLVGFRIEKKSTRSAQFLGWRMGVKVRHKKIYGK